MADPTNVLSDSTSPLRLRQTKSPLLARRSMVFEKPVEIRGHTPDLLRPKPQARPRSLNTSSEFLLKLSAFENNSQDQPLTFGDALTPDPTRSRPILSGTVVKLVTSFSNPSLLKIDMVAGEEHLQNVMFGKSQSQIVEPLESVEEDDSSCTVIQQGPKEDTPVVNTPGETQEVPIDPIEASPVNNTPEEAQEAPIDPTEASPVDNTPGVAHEALIDATEAPPGHETPEAIEEVLADDKPKAIEEPVDGTPEERVKGSTNFMPEVKKDTPSTVIQPIVTFRKRSKKSAYKTMVPIGPIARRNFRDNRPTLQEVDSNNFLSLNFIPGRVNIKHDGPLGAPSLSMQFSPYSPNTPSLYKPLTPREDDDDDDDDSVVEEELGDHELRGTHDNVAALVHEPISIVVWSTDDKEVVVDGILQENNGTIPVAIDIQMEDCTTPTGFILPDISSNEDPFLAFELNESRTASEEIEQWREDITCSAGSTDSCKDAVVSQNSSAASEIHFNGHDNSQNNLNSSALLTEGIRGHRSEPTSPAAPMPLTCAFPSSPVPATESDSSTESHTTMSEDDASLLTSSSLEPSEGTVTSSLVQQDHFTPSPTSSTITQSSLTTTTTTKSEFKRDHSKLRIDTSRFTKNHRVQPLAAPVPPPQAQGREELEDENETVIASKVSRKGALFAKKIKSIANFQYNSGRKLGKGNFGIVYNGKKISPKAGQKQEPNQQQVTLKESVPEGTEVAIKKITRKLPGEIEKLGLVQREMRVCRLFRDKVGIVPLLDIITTNKHHYLVFEKADGDLAEKIKERSSRAAAMVKASMSKELQLQLQPTSPSGTLGNVFSIDEIRAIMRTVIQGVQVLHMNGYSHKDIKPANILHKNGEGLLCDFGLCSRGDDLPRNQFFGTQEYASPEARRVMAHRSCDYIQSDIYSLGAVLYELATGSVLCKVISHGLNWQKIALFGGRHFCEMLQGMLNDLEKRWTIDQVCKSPFWSDVVASGELGVAPPPLELVTS
ncbi:hypothetical protein BGZ93_001856 [Podila epicladia]|nr:hypothetical protein BGZ93_001856 [Podila epicladia]